MFTLQIIVYILIYLLVFVLFDIGADVLNPKPGKLLKTNAKNNIVAHIYNDRTSYRQYILSFNRLIFFPFYLIGSILDNNMPHLCMEKMVVSFSGYIVKKNGKFITIWYKKDKISYRIWKNICGIQFFPSYKKKRDYTCWTTNEGDYVEYIPLSRIKKETSDVLTLYQFLKLTKQSLKKFEYNENMKYSGC